MAAKFDDGAADVGDLQFSKRFIASQLAKIAQVALIGRNRVRREPPFGRQVLQIMIDGIHGQ